MIHSFKGLFKIQKDCADFTDVQFRFNALQKIALAVSVEWFTSMHKYQPCPETCFGKCVAPLD